LDGKRWDANEKAAKEGKYGRRVRTERKKPRRQDAQLTVYKIEMGVVIKDMPPK